MTTHLRNVALCMVLLAGGCGQLIASNNGPDQIDVSVHYVQGAIQ